jgi:rubrerythrin
MKDDRPVSPTQAEQDMLQILRAERDAEQAIRNCENEARKIIDDALLSVQRIESRANQRITNMEMRHAHKLNRLIRNIENEGAVELGHDAQQNDDKESLQAVIEKLAIELCLANTVSDDESEAGK